MAQPISRLPHIYGERIGPRRRLALAVTTTLHALVSRVSGLALAGLPRVAGIPVLRGPGAGLASRTKLEAGIALLEGTAPGRMDRLRDHVLGIFLSRQPEAHGHYSRITGTCTLDVDALHRESAVEVAAAMVRCATEGWLWRSGRGRSRPDEARILQVSELARLHFLQRAVQRLDASV